MHSVSWPSILASALVALVVTLVVEYLAKPGLEARKDRIIEYNREQRAALRDIRRAAYLAFSLCNRSKRIGYKTTVTEAADYINEEALKMAQEIEELVENSRTIVDVPTWMYDEWVESADRIVAFVTALRLAPGLPGFYVGSKAPDEMWATFHAAAIRLNDLPTWRETSNWRFRRKRKLAMKIKLSPLPPEWPQIGNDNSPAD
jgi:hypothetical protein